MNENEVSKAETPGTADIPAITPSPIGEPQQSPPSMLPQSSIIPPPKDAHISGNSSRDLDDNSSLPYKSRESLRSDSSSTDTTDADMPPSRNPSRRSVPTSPIGRIKSHFSHISRPHSRPNIANEALEIEKNQNNIADGDERDPNIVVWDGPDDPENPMNFSVGFKWLITIILSMMTVCITFSSSVFSTATAYTAREFHVSSEVMVLGTSLFVLGFAVGPPVWGPLSEVYGRRLPLFIGFGISAIFQVPVAVAQNVQTIMLGRFFGGVFGSAVLAVVGGQLTDFWGPVDRGVAIAIFATAVFVGPVAGPLVGGFVVESHLGWRWTAYLSLIMEAFFGIVGLLVVPETFAPVLLSRRATRIRFETQNWAVHAKHDEQQIHFRSIVENYLLRPFAMLAKEPILILISIYMSLIYGMMYLFFLAYPIAFQEGRGWSPGIGALPFLGLMIGVLLGCAIIVYTTKTRFARLLEREGRVVPEERLVPMIIGGFMFPAGMFWFGWTSSPHITWVPQVVAGIPIGAGIMMIFLQGFNYIIDVYLMYANSALAANTLMRSMFGAGFPLIAKALYHTLGVNWASSLVGFLTAALFPVPILFYIYGKKIRGMSKFAPH